MDDELLTTEQVAARLGRGTRAVQRWVQRGLLPSVALPIKTGKGVVHLIRAADLAGFTPPPVGYPKGRPRKPAAGGGGQDREQGEVTE